MLLFINTFYKINFGSINLKTELGQQATLFRVGREIRKHMIRALWILQNTVIKEKNLWVRNLFSFHIKKKKKSVEMYVVWLSPSDRGGFTGMSRECQDISWFSSTSGSPVHNTQQ